MRRSPAAVIALFCVLGLSLTANAEEKKDCALKRFASLDLTGNGFRLVPVTIEGSAEFMVLNTNTGISGLYESTVNHLGMPTQPVPLIAGLAYGKIPVTSMTKAKSFALGEGLRFQSAEFLVIPELIFNPSARRTTAGVLGMSTFANLDIELDVARKKMNVYSQDHCKDSVVYWSHRYDSTPISFGKLGEMYFPMELEGKKIESTFSTASASTTLYTDVTKKLYGFDAHSIDVKSSADSSGKTTFHYRAMNLTSKNLSVVNADIHLLEPDPSCPVTKRAGAAAYDRCLGLHPLHMGLDVLSKLHIYIAMKEKVLYFTPADAAD